MVFLLVVPDLEIRSGKLRFSQLLKEDKGFMLSSKTDKQFIQYLVQFAIHNQLTIRIYDQRNRKGSIK
jgi:hypothetical protein